MPKKKKPYVGGPLTDDERAAYNDLREAVLHEHKGECLIRATLDGAHRACIARVHHEGDGGVRIYPVAVLLTEEEKDRILGPQGEATKEA